MPTHSPRYIFSLQLFQPLQDTVFATKADNNLWNAKEEGLDPEFEELTLIFQHIAIVVDLGRGFQLDPVDGLFGVFWFAVPYCSLSLLSHPRKQIGKILHWSASGTTD
jgi:hypothetical protein